MTLLILGVVLWSVAHFFQRLFPGARAALSEKLGDASKGIFAVIFVISVIMMVIGYRQAAFIDVYTPPSWATHVNNLMMLVAVALLGMGNSKGHACTWFRHPMLLGFGLWTLAHLLVNGDQASLYLFGGLLIWSVVQVLLINWREPAWDRPEPGPVAGDIKLVVITLVIFGVITFIHNWLGVSPFGE